MMPDLVWLSKAVNLIKEGIADKLEKDNIVVYKAGSVIRVDIKGAFNAD